MAEDNKFHTESVISDKLPLEIRQSLLNTTYYASRLATETEQNSQLLLGFAH